MFFNYNKASFANGFGQKEQNSIYKEFHFFEKRRIATRQSFEGEKGKKYKISDFKNKVLLINLWSSSCGVCVLELPLLNHLQNMLGSPKFEVVSIAVGFDDPRKVKRYFLKKGLGGLKAYIDKDKSFYDAVGANGFPTTILIDVNGQELGRTRGVVKWDGQKFVKKLRNFIQEKPKQHVLNNFSWSKKKRDNKNKASKKSFSKEDEEFLNLDNMSQELEKRFEGITEK